jgi:hypothetical protein
MATPPDTYAGRRMFYALFGRSPITDDMRQMVEDVSCVEPTPVQVRTRLLMTEIFTSRIMSRIPSIPNERVHRNKFRWR